MTEQELISEIQTTLGIIEAYIEMEGYETAESLLEQTDRLMLRLNPHLPIYRELSKRKALLWEQLRELWR